MNDHRQHIALAVFNTACLYNLSTFFYISCLYAKFTLMKAFDVIPGQFIEQPKIADEK